jgi:hypothetical protein
MVLWWMASRWSTFELQSVIEPRHLLNPKRPEANGCVEPLVGISTQKSGLGPSSVSPMDSALGAASMARWMHCVGIHAEESELDSRCRRS